MLTDVQKMMGEPVDFLGVLFTQIKVKDVGLYVDFLDFYPFETIEQCQELAKKPNARVLCGLLCNAQDVDDETLPYILQYGLLVNREFFTPVSAKRSKKTWFDSVQLLLEHGHRHDEVLEMSYGAFVGYLRACGRRVNERLAEQAMVLRYAYHGDNKGFKKFVLSLGE